MRFFKMNGLGNDYIFLSNTEKLSATLITELCNVHTGIGADGVVQFGAGLKTDLIMKIYNRDGTEAEMCGNALRCLVRHYNKPNKNVSVATKAGIRTGLFDGVNVTANLGKIVSIDTKMTEITVDSNTIKGYRVDIGNPHFVIYGQYDERIAEKISKQTSDLFPDGTNVEFVTVSDEIHRMRVYERGCGETMACGTGAAAVFATSGLQNAIIELTGGRLYNRYNEKNEILQTGQVKYNFLGEWNNV